MIIILFFSIFLFVFYLVHFFFLHFLFSFFHFTFPFIIFSLFFSPFLLFPPHALPSLSVSRSMSPPPPVLLVASARLLASRAVRVWRQGRKQGEASISGLEPLLPSRDRRARTSSAPPTAVLRTHVLQRFPMSSSLHWKLLVDLILRLELSICASIQQFVLRFGPVRLRFGLVFSENSKIGGRSEKGNEWRFAGAATGRGGGLDASNLRWRRSRRRGGRPAAETASLCPLPSDLVNRMTKGYAGRRGARFFFFFFEKHNCIKHHV